MLVYCSNSLLFYARSPRDTLPSCLIYPVNVQFLEQPHIMAFVTSPALNVVRKLASSSSGRVPTTTPPQCTQSSPVPASVQTPNAVSRRACLRQLAAAVSVLAGALLPSGDSGSTAALAGASKQTIVNSVLSGYGLPTMRDVRGFTSLTQQYGRLVVQFQYPSAWVVQRNVAPSKDKSQIQSSPTRNAPGMADAPMEGRASGLTAADYRRAEGVALFVSKIPPQKGSTIGEVSASFIVNLVTPGDATGATPEVRIIKDRMDEEGFRIIDTLYESTTVSGYTVERKGSTRATVLSDGKLYALNASCSAIRWKKISADLNVALSSFNAFIL